ncbi:MAG: carbon-nitrogen hydrolase family protein [Candidatus Omnitrophica bacterium]|nr:carbon-nitrogen hydrolase family protein [Candidatus Omnitrophota bacterium]
MKIKVACIQMNATKNFGQNLDQAIRLARVAEHQGAQVIAFPEVFLYRGSPSQYKAIAQKSEKVIHKFQHIACLTRIPILLGSILERSNHPGKYFNTSLFISEHGQIIAKYRKKHLFDVKTPEKLSVSESKWMIPGKSLIIASLFGVKWGFSICNELRFPQDFRELANRGAEVIFVPSNFLYETGKAHWHILLRSRAIENQAFIVAPAQVGTHPALKHKSFGHSLIVDPWGKVLAEGSSSKSEVVLATLDFNILRQLRRNFPVLNS